MIDNRIGNRIGSRIENRIENRIEHRITLKEERKKGEGVEEKLFAPIKALLRQLPRRRSTVFDNEGVSTIEKGRCWLIVEG